MSGVLDSGFWILGTAYPVGAPQCRPSRLVKSRARRVHCSERRAWTKPASGRRRTRCGQGSLVSPQLAVVLEVLEPDDVPARRAQRADLHAEVATDHEVLVAIAVTMNVDRVGDTPISVRDGGSG